MIRKLLIVAEAMATAPLEEQDGNQEADSDDEDLDGDEAT